MRATRLPDLHHSSISLKMKKEVVVVVGGGVGGLVCAAKLAMEENLEVLLLEKNKKVGGRMQSEKYEFKGEDYRFDTGPSLVLLPDIYKKTFAMLGEKIEEHVELLRVDPFYRVYFEGEEDYPVDLAADSDSDSDSDSIDSGTNCTHHASVSQLDSLKVKGMEKIEKIKKIKTGDAFEKILPGAGMRGYRTYMETAQAFLGFGLPAVIEESPGGAVDRLPAFLKACANVSKTITLNCLSVVLLLLLLLSYSML